jgi:hypothetical protein
MSPIAADHVEDVSKCVRLGDRSINIRNANLVIGFPEEYSRGADRITRVRGSDGKGHLIDPLLETKLFLGVENTISSALQEEKKKNSFMRHGERE